MTAIESTSGPLGTDLLDTEGRDIDLLEAYRSMLTIRRVEERVLALRRADEVAGSVHVCIGQEAAPVAVLLALDERDRILATYRGHGWALACGVPPVDLLAEVLQRATGVNGGRAGSPYLTAPQYRFIGENSIVGAGLPIANGVAMGLVAADLGGVVAVSFGDGATNQGAAHEAFVFAVARRLPVLFVCENNDWSEMTPITATVPVPLHDRARAYGMTAERVDGSDVRAVAAAARRVVEGIRAGGGPAFLEISVPRMLGHYNADIEHYRSEEDRRSHAGRDPLVITRAALGRQQGLDSSRLEEVDHQVERLVSEAEEQALAAPLPDPSTAREHVVAAAGPPRVTPLLQDGKPIALGLAANRALADELAARPEVVLFGEDIAIPGGTFGVTRSLRKQHGERVFDTPISEAAILGAALGASLQGLRPVVEIMWMDFVFVALDQLVNQAANVRYLSRGRTSAPFVVRMQQGVTPGSCAQHSQSMEAVLAHVPGLKVGLPSTPQDAYAMLRAAVADPDPVVIIESRALYQDTAPVDTEAPLEPVGGARLRREGKDLLIVTWAGMTRTVLEAADRLADQGLSAAVLDLRWLNPLDEDALVHHLRACNGKLLVVHEANVTGGFGGEIAARIAERHFAELDGPIRRLGLPDVRVPSSPTLQRALVPGVEDVVAAARELAEL